VASFHTFLIGLTARAVHLLPRAVRESLDTWSRRVARERALRRQGAFRPKS
jgi:hypothetical protein